MSTLRVDEIRTVDDISGDGEVKIFGKIFTGADADKLVPDIDDFSAVATQSGYLTFPSNQGVTFIKQWGRISVGVNGTSGYQNWPLAFSDIYDVSVNVLGIETANPTGGLSIDANNTQVRVHNGYNATHTLVYSAYGKL